MDPYFLKSNEKLMMKWFWRRRGGYDRWLDRKMFDQRIKVNVRVQLEYTCALLALGELSATWSTRDGQSWWGVKFNVELGGSCTMTLQCQLTILFRGRLWKNILWQIVSLYCHNNFGILFKIYPYLSFLYLNNAYKLVTCINLI